MYESKYRQYLPQSTTRFAEAEEICATARVAFDPRRQAAGVPLCSRDSRVYVDHEDNHTIVVGPTGCKKSRVTAFTTVASIIEAGESAVINDPKGEIYRRTAARAKEVGADVVLLNFRKPGQSQCWNPLTQAMRFLQQGREEEALQSINDFVETVIAPSMEKTVDNYWGDTTRNFLTGLLLVLLYSVTPEYFNMKTLIPFCYESAGKLLKRLVERMDQTSTAVFGLRAVTDLEAERTRSCVYSTLLGVLRPFIQNQRLLSMLCNNSVDMEQLGQKQTVVYLVYPDEKQNLNFLVNLFYTQAYETMVSVAAGMGDDRLPVRVNFVLDEFSNLTTIENFENRISEARSKNIRYFLFVQSFAQLKQKYKENAETILSNCNNWVCFSSKEMDFLEKLSKICGKETDYLGREHDLLSPAEMQHFHKGWQESEVLLIKQGQYPYVATLPDFDCLGISRRYPMEEMTIFREPPRVRAVTVDQWVDYVEEGVFRTPFPRSA